MKNNPLGAVLNLLIVCSLWWLDIYAKNRLIALAIIFVKILLLTSIPLILIWRLLF